jgi:predicted transcriptional regulator
MFLYIYNHFYNHQNKRGVMTEEEIVQELLEFFKALSETNRLKIIGLLAQQPLSVETIAETLGIGVSTTSHHLARLAKAGLVSAKVDGHFYIYSLHTEAIEKMAQRLLSKDTLPRLSESVDLDIYERKVLATFTDSEGKITAFPAQEKKFICLLKYVLKSFEMERHYSEKEVNEILLHFNEDVATLRRGLIEYRLMKRQGGGGEYWRV